MRRVPAAPTPRHGLARVLSRRGVCSRSQAAAWIADGRVSVDGRVVRDPEHPMREGATGIAVDGVSVDAPARRYLALNKPRGLVTTAADEQGRETVYRCFNGAALGWIAPVGRLDRASEGLLLFSNDPAWAAAVTDPARGPVKTYHVQIGTLPVPALLRQLVAGIDDAGEHLRARDATLLRAGGRNAWLEITLDEGRNRHIRRLLDALGIPVLRLVRTAIGGLALGTLAKGAWRELDAEEAAALAPRADDSGPGATLR